MYQVPDEKQRFQDSVVQKKHVVCFSCSVLFVAVGIVLATCCTIFMDAIIRSILPMTDTNSLLFQVWQDSSNKQLPLLRNYYFWNLTNPSEVFLRTEIPNFVKVGPYVYREHLYSPEDSITWNSGKTTLHFNYESDLVFDEVLSVDPVHGQLHRNDKFTTINLALWAAAYRLSRFPQDSLEDDAVKFFACENVQGIVNHTVLGKNGFFVQPTVEAYLFGYVDDIWQSIQNMSWLIQYNNPSIFHVVFNHSQPAPAPYTYRAGLTCPIWDNQTACNTSGTQQSTIYTGLDDISNLAQYKEWAGQTSLWWWTGEPSSDNASVDTSQETCQELRGSNAMNYPPGLTEADTPYIFVDNIFRSVKLAFTQHATVKRVPTLQFGISPDEKLLGTPNCRCYDQRYPAVFNLSRPYFAPMLVSQPSFWGIPNPASVYVNESDLPPGQHSTVLNFTVNGTHINDILPTFDPTDAELVLRVEPHTGSLVEAKGRIQLGTWLRPLTVNGCSGLFPELLPKYDSAANTTSYFSYTMMPIMYLDRTVTAPDSLADLLYNAVVLPILLGRIIGSIIAVTSAGLGALLWHILRRRRHMQQLVRSSLPLTDPSNEGARLLQ